MVTYTRGLGGILIIVGVAAYVATGFESVTALIPAFLGLPILILGLIAGGEVNRRPLIVTALILALLGVLGAAMNLADLPALLAGDDVERPAAVATSAIMALLCLLYLIAGARWWFAGRQRSIDGT